MDLYRAALDGVLHSRTSFFDTTPIGKQPSIFVKPLLYWVIPIILPRQNHVSIIKRSRYNRRCFTPHSDAGLSLSCFTLRIRSSCDAQVLTTFCSVLGTAGLVFYTFPYLGILFLPLGILYYGTSIYYRRSSVETKRLDSLNRSMLYASYTGKIITSRIFKRVYTHETHRNVDWTLQCSCLRYSGKSLDPDLFSIDLNLYQKRAIADAEYGLDMENRAYLMTVVMQRWLALRLEFFANFLVLGIGIFGAGFRNSINPSKIGVVMSYTLAGTVPILALIIVSWFHIHSDRGVWFVLFPLLPQLLSLIKTSTAELITLFAQSEQNMNAVERVLHYVELPAEGSEQVSPSEPSSTWPASGQISFKEVKLAYREGLPLVLKGISFDIKAGEKVRSPLNYITKS